MRRAARVYKVAVGDVEWKDLALQEPDPRDRTLGFDEERRLFDEVAEHLRPPLLFSLLVGVRLDNAVMLDWSQVDWEQRVIRFRVKSKKPGGKALSVPMSEAVTVLLANLGTQRAGRVFLYQGRPIKSWRTAWEGALRRAGIEDLRWHDLRHTFGSRLVSNGADISLVQELMGHADIQTTLRYVHPRQAEKRDALETLSRTIPEPTGAEVSNTLKKKA